MGGKRIEIDADKFLLWLKVAGAHRTELPILSIGFNIVNEYGADDKCLRSIRLCFQGDTLWQYVPSWGGYYRVGAFGSNFRGLGWASDIPRLSGWVTVQQALQMSGRYWYIGRFQPKSLWRGQKFWLPNRRVEKRAISEFLDSLSGDQEIVQWETPPEVARQLFEDWLK